MQITLTIELDGVKFDVEAYFDNDDEGSYLEEAYISKTSDFEAMQAWADASEREKDAAIWAAFDDYVKESNEP